MVAGEEAFVVLFAPFMAIRHILPVIPAVLLLLGANRKRLPARGWQAVGLVVTASLGALLAISDCASADGCRQQAPKVFQELPADVAIWDEGHWGWQ